MDPRTLIPRIDLHIYAHTPHSSPLATPHSSSICHRQTGVLQHKNVCVVPKMAGSTRGNSRLAYRNRSDDFVIVSGKFIDHTRNRLTLATAS